MSKRGAGDELENQGLDAVKRVKPDEHPEGSWTCASCSNVNWPKRTKCNRQGCNMPKDPNEAAGGAPTGGDHPEGSWACLACGNVNWPKRTTCNKASCRLPRSGQPGGGMGMPPPYGMMGGMGRMGATAPSLGNHPPGSWACPVCSNVNWPQRTMCNKGNCGTARPANAGQQQAPMPTQDPMQAYYAAQAATYGTNPYADNMAALAGMPGMEGMMQGMQGMPAMGGMNAAYGMDPQQALLMAGVGMGEGVGGNHPPGSWSCVCGNVNWPKRTTCNKAGCGLPKPGGGGMPGAAGGGNLGGGHIQHPEGSWACPVCSNINWPKRTTCNKAGCDTARPVL